MKRIDVFFKNQNKDFFKLLNQKLFIYKKNENCIFCLKVKNNDFIYYKSKFNKITILDRLLSHFYDSIINYFEQKKKELLKNFKEENIFCFEYLINNKFTPEINKNLIFTNFRFKDKIYFFEKFLKRYSKKFNIVLNKPLVVKNELTIDEKNSLIFLAKNYNEENFYNFLKTFNINEDFSKLILIFKNKITNKNSYLKIENLFSRKEKEKIKFNDLDKILFSDIVLFLNKNKVNLEKIFFSSKKISDDFYENLLILSNNLFKRFLKQYKNIYKNFWLNNLDEKFKNNYNFYLNFKILKKFDYELYKFLKLKKNRNFVNIYKYFIIFSTRKVNNTFFENDFVLEMQNSFINEIYTLLSKFNRVYSFDEFKNLFK